MKIHFSIEESLKQCPPAIYYKQFSGIKFIKRLVLQRNKVIFEGNKQSRETDADNSRVENLVRSYEVHGFIPNRPPQVIVENPDRKGTYIGRGGWGRDAAQGQLGWETAIYDIVEFDSPTAEYVFTYSSNSTEEHTIPAEPMTQTSLRKGVVNATKEGYLSNNPTDEEILTFLLRLDPRKKQDHKKVLKKIRKGYLNSIPHLKSWCTEDARRYADEIGLPPTKEGVMVRTPSNFDKVLIDSIKSSEKRADDGSVHKLKKINPESGKPFEPAQYEEEHINPPARSYYTPWVEEPDPVKLIDQRKKLKKQVTDSRETITAFISRLIEMPVDEVNKRMGKGTQNDRWHLHFNGFVPQVIDRNPNNEGFPIENGLVDYDGIPWQRIDNNATS